MSQSSMLTTTPQETQLAGAVEYTDYITAEV